MVLFHYFCPILFVFHFCFVRFTFLQPSLPRRLRFNRQHSDLTPSKNKNAPSAIDEKERQREKDKEALDAANDDIKKKIDIINDFTHQIDELKSQISQLTTLNGVKDVSIYEKAAKITELEIKFGESEMANDKLKLVHFESIEKIKVLEGEIKTVVKDHDNEMNKLIQKNSHLTEKYERLIAQNKLQCEKMDALKTELDNLRTEYDLQRNQLNDETAKLHEKDTEHRKLLDENIQLLDGMERIKKQAEDDMLSYAMESKNLLNQLQIVKDEKSKIITELCRKEELLNEMQDELNNKLIDVDTERDDIKENLKIEFNATLKKYEQQIATLNEVHDMKIKEMESISILERTQLINEHKESIAKLLQTHTNELERINEQCEEKIRISDIQIEEKLKNIDTTIEQTIHKEKEIWKMEIDKCQKIAEHEIMQCEYEKQDLKTLLESANELMREKDEKIQQLQNKVNLDVSGYVKNREEIEFELNEAQIECAHLLSEQYKYQIALNNTRSTMNILMERLRKSDHDVELLKEEIDTLIEQKLDIESTNIKLMEEMDEYRHTLTALRNSSICLEREMLEKELAYEKIISSEQETLDAVNKISKLFSDKIDDNLNKYADLYNDIKKKYDSREMYIKDMKVLLDEFATGIELARLELDIKNKQLIELQHENKTIKLEISAHKFKLEQFEKYAQEQNELQHSATELIEHITDNKLNDENSNDESMVLNQTIEKIIVQLENDVQNECRTNSILMDVYSDEDKINAENMQLKEKLTEKMRQIEFLQEIVEIENSHATENMTLRRQVTELEQKMLMIEKFANETVEKCTEMSSNKKLEKLMDTNANLKNVSEN